MIHKYLKEIADGKSVRQIEAPPEVALLGYLERFNNGDVGDAATFAHRLQAPSLATGMQSMHKRSHKLCTCRAQWVAQRDGSSIDVELVWISTCVLQPRHWDGCEGFVHFVEVNIINAHAGAL